MIKEIGRSGLINGTQLSLVMPYRGRNAPLMLAAFAGVVHDGERAHGKKRKRDEDNYQWGLHCDLAIARSPGTYRTEFPRFKLNAR